MKLGHSSRLNALRRGDAGVTPTPSAPAVVANPSLTGTPQVGVPLTFNTGSASGFPAPTAVRTVRNAAGGGLIATLAAGETTWTPEAGQVGLNVFPRVVWTNSEGSATGNGGNVGPIAAGGSADFTLSNSTVATTWGTVVVGNLEPVNAPPGAYFVLVTEDAGLAVVGA